MKQALDRKVIFADLSLFFVAAFWGSNFVIMKLALEEIAPFTYLGIRFTLAFLIMALLLWRRISRAKVDDILAGCLIGLFLFAGFAFQTVGLLYTTPANSGFITGMAVVFVPFLYYLVTKRSPGWAAFTGALLAAGGLYLLSANPAAGFNLGDLLTLISAFLFAAHIIAIGIHVVKRDPVILAVVQIAFTGLASVAVSFLFEPAEAMFNHHPLVWAAIIYAVVFCTIGAFMTQTIAQRYTPPTHAVLILSLEAVFAGLFSYLFFDERFTPAKLSGALLIFAGILLTELRPVLAARLAARRAAPVEEIIILETSAEGKKTAGVE